MNTGELIYRVGRWVLCSSLHRARYRALAFPEIVVVSGGGSGTTMLIRTLARFTTVNRDDDLDGLKHRPRPPKLKSKAPKKIIFIRASPEQQVRSLNRRGTLRFQALKLAGFRALFVSQGDLDSFFKRQLREQLREYEKLEGPNLAILTYPDFIIDPEQVAVFAGVDVADFRREMPDFRQGSS